MLSRPRAGAQRGRHDAVQRRARGVAGLVGEIDGQHRVRACEDAVQVAGRGVDLDALEALAELTARRSDSCHSLARLSSRWSPWGTSSPAIAQPPCGRSRAQGLLRQRDQAPDRRLPGRARRRPLLFFAGYFRAVLTRLHPTGRPSANVALAGAAVAATGLAVQSLIQAALAKAAQTSELSDQALQALNALDGWSFCPTAIGLRPSCWRAAWRSCEAVASSRRSLPGLPSFSACWRSFRSTASSPRSSPRSGWWASA